MKKITAILIALVMVATCAFLIPDDTYAAAKAKYVKVKQVTYEKMKKTIASQKKTIASQKKTITARNKTITSQKSTITTKTNKITELQNTIKEKKSTISWLWSQLEEFGYFYNYDTHKWEVDENKEQVKPLDWAELQQTEGIIPVMEEQTELSIDNVQIVDSWKAWVCYYVEADGDLYVITMQRGVVDVCQILN